MRRLASILAVTGLVAGLGASWVLLARALDLMADTASASDVCSAVFGGGCDEALLDPASMVLGLPLAGWGILYFGGVLLLLLLGSFLDDTFRRGTRAGAGAILVLGAVASVWLLGLFARGEVVVCPLCVVVHVVNLLVLPLHVLRRRGELRKDLAALRAGARYAWGREPTDQVAARWRAVGFLFVLLSLAVTYQRILLDVREHEAAGAEFSPERVLRDYVEAERHDLGLGPDEVFVGATDARVDLVVFGDAYCPHCRTFWMTAGDLVKQHGEDLRIVFKHLPLDKSCNLGVAATLHSGACDAAYGLEAARRQDLFWPYYEALARVPPESRGEAQTRAAVEAGLDMGRFRADLADPASRERVERDVALGRRLGFLGIPEFYLNGRRVPDPPLRSLPLLLDHLLVKKDRRGF